MTRVIGTLAEKSLHAALKAHYALPGDALECDLGGYVIDIVRGLPDNPSCIEIQTGSLGKMKPKLAALLDRYPVRVVHPIAQERHIVRIDADGVIVSRRKSPRRGTVYELFPELVSFPALMTHPNLSLDVALVREEAVWIDDGRGSWRRKRWSIHDRRLIDVVGVVTLAAPADFAALLPTDLPPEFDSGELAKAIRQPRYVAQKMAYCLRAMGVLTATGKRGRAWVYGMGGA
ncbi:MAG: hypothetical protein LC121_26200 [Anaerolineae bacterium]|nr:hypothetical protein [Anaerolineae bacterium]